MPNGKDTVTDTKQPVKRPKRKCPNPDGRPRNPVDLTELEKLASLQCTYAEMAAFFGISDSTLRKNKKLSSAIEKGREIGKLSIRRKQLQVAMGGNVAMLIWLGKQWLGQTDKSDLTVDSGVTIIWDERLGEL